MKRKILFGIIFCFSANFAHAQFIEDALRFSQQNNFITPRAGGLGISYHGVADDFAALYYNPAGLTLIPRNELSLGIGFLRNNTESRYLNQFTPFGSNSTTITHAGFVAPFKSDDTPIAIAIGYALENDFENTVKFSAFNPASSFVPALMNAIYPERKDNFAFNLGLAFNDTVSKRFVTDLYDSLFQKSDVRESGGIHAISGGAAFNLSQYVSAGAGLTVRGGTYNYVRMYSEEDIYNKYNTYDETNFRTDLAKFDIEENLTQEIAGIGGVLGVQARVGDFMRFGVSVKTPTFYSITEEFKRSGTAYFDNADNLTAHDSANSGQNSYRVRTPFVFGGGFSLNALGLTFSAGAEYSDVTQLRFSDEAGDLEKNNFAIVDNLVGQTTWGAGVEYEVPGTPFVARGSYTAITSAYQKDVAGADTRIAALGLGAFVAKNVRLDGLMRWTETSQQRSNYSGSEYLFTQKPMNIALQLTYRY